MFSRPHQPGHSQLRRGRASLCGQLYLLTTVAQGRRPRFVDHQVAQAVCRLIGSKRTWGDAQLLCWVLMPDHWHGLLRLGQHRTLSDVMRGFKGASARLVNEVQQGRGPVWASGFHDHALRADEQAGRVARYIVANPVRAGLVDRVGQYPWWDAVWLDGRG